MNPIFAVGHEKWEPKKKEPRNLEKNSSIFGRNTKASYLITETLLVLKLAYIHAVFSQKRLESVVFISFEQNNINDTLFEIARPPATSQMLQLHVRSHIRSPRTCHHDENLCHLGSVDLGHPELLQYLHELLLCSA